MVDYLYIDHKIDKEAFTIVDWWTQNNMLREEVT